MFQLPAYPPRKVWISALAPLALFHGTAAGQDFSTRIGNSNPLGIGAFIPSESKLDMDLGLKGKFKGQFFYGVGAETTYSSNFFLTEDNEDDELTLQFAPWITYVSDPEGGAPISLTANYSPSFQAFLENSDLNSADQNANFTLTFTGSRTDVSLFGSYSQLSATDELTREFVDGALFTTGIRANRQIASRTSMNGGATFAITDYSTGDVEGAEMYTTYFGGLWEATQRLDVGSTIRYTMSESDNVTGTSAWALLLDLRYKAGERIWLSSSLGPQFTEDGESGSSIGLTGDLSARYLINERWTWTTSLRAVTVPSPDETDYVVNNTTLSTSLQRQLLRGSIGGGVDFRLSQYESVGDTVTSPDDEQNIRFFLTYGRPLFSERIGLNTRISYAVNDGEAEWSQVEASVGLNLAF